MRSLHLDYHEDPAAFRLGGMLLLAGALLAAVAGAEYSTAREEAVIWAAKVEALRKSAGRGDIAGQQSPRETEASAQEAKAAYGAYQRLRLPWDTLFSALEASQAGGVAMLALEPDAGKSTIRVTAEAKSDTDMLNYVQQLQQADALADVTLASHQTKQGDPSRPLRFIVNASWIRKQP